MDSAFLAFTVILLMIALICLGILAYVYQNGFLKERRLRSEAELRCEHLESDVQAAITRNGDLERRLEAARRRNASLRAEFEQIYLEREKRRWFGRIQRKAFRSKADIGVYLLYPMLHFLGYTDDAFEVDYPVTLVGGPRGQAVLVSCYVCTVVNENAFAPRLLLEAIPPDEGITDSTREQVTWKAFSAGVPKFGITDGSFFELYILATPKRPVIQCRISELASNWDNIQAQLGANAP
jgi:hypothetical protein